MFLYSSWRSIPLSTRIIIANTFGVQKIGPTHVVNNYVESDGYRIEDIERALNIDAIQKYVATNETDMVKLMDMLIAKAEGREYIGLVTEPVIVNEQVISPTTGFCDQCDSKGVRHKKVCPKYVKTR